MVSSKKLEESDTGQQRLSEGHTPVRATVSHVALETVVRVTPLLTQTDAGRGWLLPAGQNQRKLQRKGAACLRKAFEEGDGERGRGRPDQELILDLRDLSGRGVRS